MKYRVIREFYGNTDAMEPNLVFTDFLEANNPDNYMRPYCLGGNTRCNISEFSNKSRIYEIRALGVRQVITLYPCEDTAIPDRSSGGINCLLGC